MNVHTARLGVAVYLAPDGPIVEETLETMEESVRSAGTGGPTNIVVDLKRVPIIDSRGLEFLLDLSTELRDAGGSLRMADACELCKEILAVTKLDQMIPVYDDLEAAGRSFL